MTRTANRRHRSGFSLVEALVATTIVGLGAVALLTSIGSGTRVNAAGRDITQAAFLAQEMREWTMKLPFSDTDPADAGNPPGPDGSDPLVFVDDLDDMMGQTYSPPRDGQGLAISDMNDWSQTINMTWRNPADVGQTVADGASDVIRVEADISHNSVSVLTTSWLVARR